MAVGSGGDASVGYEQVRANRQADSAYWVDGGSVGDLSDRYPTVFDALVREVEMIRARQMIASSTELS